MCLYVEHCEINKYATGGDVRCHLEITASHRVFFYFYLVKVFQVCVTVLNMLPLLLYKYTTTSAKKSNTFYYLCFVQKVHVVYKCFQRS